MDAVNSTTASSVSTSSTTSDTASSDDQSVISSDFETFLVMLTAQLENQDPLNPMSSSDYAVQLATFSSVEQQVKTNDLLTDMIQGANLTSLADLSGWVGMEARSNAPVSFEGEPVELFYEPQTGAVRTELLVRDDNDEIVQRLDVTEQGSPVYWTGVQIDGVPLPDGLYSFEQLSYESDSTAESLPVESFATVQEVRNGADGVSIVLESGIEVQAASISAVKNP